MAFQLVVIEDIIRVLPNQFGDSLKTVAHQLLKSKYESTLNPDYGFIINILKIIHEILFIFFWSRYWPS